MRFLSFCLLVLYAAAFAVPAQAQQGPLRITIEEGIIKPLPFAVPDFQAETGEAGQLAGDLARVVAADLESTGVFREIPSSAFIADYADFNAAVSFPDWKAINAQALVTGAVSVSGSAVNVKFRVYDVVSGTALGDGLQFSGTTEGWRSPTRCTNASQARAAISTVAWFMCPRQAPRTSARSGWRSWIMTVQTSAF